METVYIEQANGQFEAWTYIDGQREYIALPEPWDKELCLRRLRGWKWIKIVEV